MTLNVIELNDAAVRVFRDGVVVASSPGVALVESRQVLAGSAAMARSELNPRAVHRHFWQRLNEDPLADSARHCRHHADLAYHHLLSLLATAGRPAEAVLAVPGHYDRSQLALLLGIAAAADLNIGGLVDSAVAAVAGCAPAGRYVVVDLHQHHVTLTTVEVSDAVSRIAVDNLEQAGLHRIEAAATELIADALMSQARFDARHDAATAQLLCDQLPLWLVRGAGHDDVQVAIEHRGRRFQAQIAARDLVRVTTMVVATISEHLPGGCQVLVGAGLAALPGALAALAPAQALPADAVYRGVAEHRIALGGGSSGVHFCTRLPPSRAPLLAALAAAGRPAVRVPTHMLAGNTAHPLSAQPLYLHADGAVASARGAAANCAVTRAAARVLLQVNGSDARVNGVAVNGSCTVEAGDHITFSGGRALFLPIVVSDPSAS